MTYRHKSDPRRDTKEQVRVLRFVEKQPVDAISRKLRISRGRVYQLIKAIQEEER